MTDAAVGPGSCQTSGSGEFDGQAFKFKLQGVARYDHSKTIFPGPEWLIEGFSHPILGNKQSVIGLPWRYKTESLCTSQGITSERGASLFVSMLHHDIAQQYIPPTVHPRPDDREGRATAVARGRHI